MLGWLPPSLSSSLARWWWWSWPIVFYSLLPTAYTSSRSFIALVATIGLLSWLIVCLSRRQWVLSRSQKLCLAIIGLYALGGFVSYWLFPNAKAEKHYFRELETLVVGVGLLLAIGPQTIHYKKVLWAALYGFVAFGTLSMMVNVHWHGLYRHGIGNSLVIPTFNVLVIALALVWVLWPYASWKSRLAYLPLLGAAGYAIILSETRGAWLNCVVLSSIILWTKLPSMRIRAASFAIGLMLLLLVGTLPQVQTRLQSIATDIAQYQQGNFDSSIGLRFAMWEQATKKIVAEPFLPKGYSHESILIALGHNRSTHMDHYHNEILQQWVQKGLIGFIAIVALLLLPLLGVSKVVHPAGLILSVGVFIAGLTNVFLFRNFPMLFYLVTISLLCRMGGQRLFFDTTSEAKAS